MRIRSSSDIRDAAITLAITIPIYFVIQAAIILIHEFAHSTAAWLLGYSATPFTVVWGNLLTLRGWDEGVPYDRLFPLGGNPAESVIGGIPLFLHAIFVTAGLALLLRRSWKNRRWLFNALYWFVVINLAELIAYIIMRPFIPDGDTGRFNQGLGLSPWILFIAGTAFLVAALGILFWKILPIMDDVVAPGNRITHWAILVGTDFVLFLWGSGLRMFSLYPDPQWTFGLIGAAAFALFVGAALLFGKRGSYLSSI